MKYILLKKSQLTVSAVALFVAVTLAFTASSMISAATKRVLPIYRVDRDDKCISLTFDAAWSADDTDDIIRLLDKYNAKATFFASGRTHSAAGLNARLLFAHHCDKNGPHPPRSGKTSGATTGAARTGVVWRRTL